MSAIIHTTVELSTCTVEIRNEEETLIFSRDSSELLRLSFAEFDQLLEAVARTEGYCEPLHD